MKVNAVAAAVSLLVAGLLALLVALTRWQAVHLLSADQFYMVLTAHGIDALIFWIIFFEMAILHFASSTLLRCRMAAPRWAWLGFILMLVGAITTNVAIFQGNSSMFISLVTFGFIGGITGVVMGTEQINLIIHNTIYVPAHFHATVVTGTTLAFMALTFVLIPVLFRRQMILPGLAKLQPYIFGGGMTILILFMLGAGTLGVARRHWDMDFTGAALSFEYSGMAYTLMAIGAAGGVIAVVGGGAFLLITVGSLVFGKKLEPSAGFLQSFGKPLADSAYSSKRPERVPLAPKLAVEEHGSSGFEAPGTFVLALVLLVSFIVYYFINWNYLASVWPMG